MQLIQFFSCITHAIAVMVAEKQISFELASLQVSRRSTDKRMNKRTNDHLKASLGSRTTINLPFSSPNALSPSSATTAP